MGIPLYDMLQSQEITLKNIEPNLARQTSQVESVIRDTTLVETPETDRNDNVSDEYYIIIGSSRNLIQTQKTAGKLKNDFNTNIIVLPVTKEGYYRISYGAYSSLEEAKTAIKSIRTSIKPDAWIFSAIP